MNLMALVAIRRVEYAAAGDVHMNAAAIRIRPDDTDSPIAVRSSALSDLIIRAR